MNKQNVGYIAIVAMLSVTSVFSINLFFRERTARDIVDINVFPHKVSDWSGTDMEVTEKEYKILETRNLILREYENVTGDKAYLFIVYSETNRSVFHPPEVCLIGSGLSIEGKTSDQMRIGDRDFSMNKLYTRKENRDDIVLYCYKVGNFYTDNFYLQQVYFAFNQVLGRRTSGATIRVSMTVRGNKAKTLSLLKGFMQSVVKETEKLKI